MPKILTGLAVILPWCVTGITLCFTIPVYPLLAHQRRIPSLVQGFYFSLSSVPFLFVFLYLPYLQRKCGMKYTYICHLLLASLSTFMMSSLYFINSIVIFSIVCLILQILNGMAGSSINYLYTILARRIYPQNFEFMIELPNAIYIITFGLAPLAAANISARWGFHVCCYIMSVFSLGIIIYVQCVLSKEASDGIRDLNSSSSDQQQHQQASRLSYWEYFKKPKVLSSTGLVFLAYCAVNYSLSFLAIELHYNFNIEKSQLGNFALIGAVAGILTATPGVLILRKCLRLTTIMASGIVAALLGVVLMGFCPLFRIPHQVKFIYAGLFFVGMGFSLMSVPYIPCLVSYYQKKPHLLRGIQQLRNEAKAEEIASKTVGIYSFTLGFANIVSPVAGRLLYEYIGYQHAYTFLSVLTIICGVIFLIWGGVFQKEEQIPVAVPQRLEQSSEEQSLVLNETK